MMERFIRNCIHSYRRKCEKLFGGLAHCFVIGDVSAGDHESDITNVAERAANLQGAQLSAKSFTVRPAGGDIQDARHGSEAESRWQISVFGGRLFRTLD